MRIRIDLLTAPYNVRRERKINFSLPQIAGVNVVCLHATTAVITIVRRRRRRRRRSLEFFSRNLTLNIVTSPPHRYTFNSMLLTAAHTDNAKTIAFKKLLLSRPSRERIFVSHEDATRRRRDTRRVIIKTGKHRCSRLLLAHHQVRRIEFARVEIAAIIINYRRTSHLAARDAQKRVKFSITRSNLAALSWPRASYAFTGRGDSN